MEENNTNEQPTYRMYTSTEKNKKQTYIPKICSTFLLTNKCLFDIIQT